MAVYHFFGWLWMMNFVIALGECVLAGAFASWYFAFHKPDVSINDDKNFVVVNKYSYA